MKSKILLSAPTSEYKDYCMKDWVKWITNDFSQLDYDILIVDNSKDPEYHKQIQKEIGNRGVVLHLPYKKGRNIQYTIAESNEMIRKYFIEGKYEYLFFNESDIFAPRGTIEYLVQLNKYVVSLPYFIFHHYNSKILGSAFEKAGYVRGSVIKPIKSSFIEFNGRTESEINIGLGALLIHRGVLDVVDFNIDETLIDKSLSTLPHSDTFFHAKLKLAGIPTDMVKKHFALHLNGDWERVYDCMSEEVLLNR